MADTINRVIADAALAKRFDKEIDKRANQHSVSTLVSEAEKNVPDAQVPGASGLTIAKDTDGVFYIVIDDE